jgi:hypothetical protein
VVRGWFDSVQVKHGVENFKQSDSIYGMTFSSLSGVYIEYAVTNAEIRSVRDDLQKFE